MKRPTGVTRHRLGNELRCARVAEIDIHRAELEDLDQLVVEAVALLPNSTGPGEVSFTASATAIIAVKG